MQIPRKRQARASAKIVVGGGDDASSTDDDIPFSERARSGSFGGTPRAEAHGSTTGTSGAPKATGSGTAHVRPRIPSRSASAARGASIDSNSKSGSGSSRPSVQKSSGAHFGISIPHQATTSAPSFGSVEREKPAESQIEGPSSGERHGREINTWPAILQEAEPAARAGKAPQGQADRGLTQKTPSAAGSDDHGVVAVLEGDDYVELSLLDPLLKNRIVYPCKGDKCSHFALFDKNTFVDAHRIFDERKAAQGSDLLVNALRQTVKVRIMKICDTKQKLIEARHCGFDYVSCDEEVRYSGGSPGKTFIHAVFRVHSQKQANVAAMMCQLASDENDFGFVLYEQLANQVRGRESGAGVVKNLQKICVNLKRAYHHKLIKEDLERLVELHVLPGCNSSAGDVHVRLRVDPPPCPICNKTVLGFDVCESLQRALEHRSNELKDADVVVVDKSYSIIRVARSSQDFVDVDKEGDDAACLSDDCSSPVNGYGRPDADKREEEGRSRGAEAHSEQQAAAARERERERHRRRGSLVYNDEVHDYRASNSEERSRGQAFSPRAGASQGSANAEVRTEGLIVKAGKSKKEHGWFCFVKASCCEENIYCNLRFMEKTIAAYARSLPGDEEPENAINSWLRGKRVIFKRYPFFDKRQPGKTTFRGKDLEILDLDADAPLSGTNAQMSASARPARADDVLGLSTSAAPPPNCQAPTSGIVHHPVQHPRLVVPPRDPRVALRDPRLSRQPSATPVVMHPVPEPEDRGVVLGADGDGHIGASGEDYSIGCEDEDEEVMEAWLLLNGAYLCKMKVEPIQVRLISAGAPAYVEENKFHWSGCACIDVTETLHLEVRRPR